MSRFGDFEGLRFGGSGERPAWSHLYARMEARVGLQVEAFRLNVHIVGANSPSTREMAGKTPNLIMG